jgi:molecular chaperone HtpG
VRGVVDTEDLPLNVSRETLQDNVLIRKIATNLAKHVLSDLQKMAKDMPEDYETFWREHGKVFKLGYSDFANREAFAELVRFNSSASKDADGLVSLADYAARMPESQDQIYYCFVQSRAAAELNPHLEIFREKGLEVLYLYEPVDEFLMEALGSYQDKQLTAAEHADVKKLESFESKTEEEEKPEPLAEDERRELDQLLADMKTALGDKVADVRVSERLRQSPACLVNPDGQMTSSMDKIMRVISKDDSIPAKTMEINPDHPLIRSLVKIHGQNAEDPFLRQAVEQLYESSLLLEGYLNDPHALVGRIQDLLTKAGEWRLQAES